MRFGSEYPLAGTALWRLGSEDARIWHYYNKDLALENINLEIKSGEFIAIIGESGSGKSTLLSVLSTLLKPTSGDIIYENTDYKDIKNIDEFRKNNIGFIFQFHYLS